MHNQSLPAAGARVDNAVDFHAQELRSGATTYLLVGNERLDVSGLNISNSDTVLLARIPMSGLYSLPPYSGG
jgi:hypothetical protein